jgi:hypothetical protein
MAGSALSGPILRVLVPQISLSNAQQRIIVRAFFWKGSLRKGFDLPFLARHAVLPLAWRYQIRSVECGRISMPTVTARDLKD